MSIATFLLSLSWTEFPFLTSGFLSCQDWARSGPHTPTLPSAFSCWLVALPFRASVPLSVKGRIEQDDIFLNLRLDIFQVDSVFFWFFTACVALMTALGSNLNPTPPY